MVINDKPHLSCITFTLSLCTSPEGFSRPHFSRSLFSVVECMERADFEFGGKFSESADIVEPGLVAGGLARGQRAGDGFCGYGAGPLQVRAVQCQRAALAQAVRLAAAHVTGL